MMVVGGVPFTWHLIEIVPILFTLMLFALSLALIIAHVGVYLYDLGNILEFVLRFAFYLTPIMWHYNNFTFSLTWLLKLNPMSIIMGSFRSCILYGKSPMYAYLFVICVCSLVLIEIGYRMISHYEDTYARII
jgi:lipopolysaccharide transport system permease protein/teichoic acid transport system permease protein